MKLIDVMEQVIERPKKSFSKEKKHTFKTEIRAKPDDNIVTISKSYKGKTHNFKIHKESDLMPKK